MSTEGEVQEPPKRKRKKWKRSKESIARQKATLAAKRALKLQEMDKNVAEVAAEEERALKGVQEAIILLRKAYREIKERGEWHEGDLYTVLALRALGG